jgi:hypothetical protein
VVWIEIIHKVFLVLVYVFNASGCVKFFNCKSMGIGDDIKRKKGKNGVPGT